MNVKVKFFGCTNKGLNWRVVSEPFTKIQSDIIFGRNKRDRSFIPLVGMNDLSDNAIVCLAKNTKGTNILTPPSAPTTDALLVFATVEGGFRGGIRKFNVGGTIIAEASAASACESALSIAFYLEDKQEVILEEYGRYGTFFHQYVNENGNPVKNKLNKEDFNYLHGI